MPALRPARSAGQSWAPLALLLLALPVSACRTARGAERREVRLAERSGSPPPILPTASYAIEPSERLPAAVTSLQLPRATDRQSFALGPGALLPRHSYRLKFTAQVDAKGCEVRLEFREPKRGQTFRTYAQPLEPGPAREHTLELTAPVYVEQAALVVDATRCAMTFGSASLRERSPLPTTVAVRSWAKSFVPPGYGLVFNDEFDGTVLDRRKWFTRYIYDNERLDRLNDENQRYIDDDASHRVAGGVLSLTARRARLSQPSGINYESGLVRSDFTLHYGFFEARVKMPSGLGTWAAFWVNSDVSERGRLGHPPEIDFFEFVNNGKDDKVDKIHSAATRTPQGFEAKFLYTHPSFVEKHQDYHAPFDFDAGFHTIGTEWTPTDYSLFVDGLKVFTRTVEWKYQDGELAGPAHVLLNLAIGGKWAGRYGIDDAAFPQALQVDWVRVYQKVPPNEAK
jgi:beta-glucanase (GH16 family)